MKHYNSVRVFLPHWADDMKFRQFCEFAEEYRDVIDQITFFSNDCHSPMTLERAKKNCDILKTRIAEAKKMGFSCGINVLATVGHHEQNLPDSVKGDWFHMTSIDGCECGGSYCMSDKRYFEEYLKTLYRIQAETNPDFIWIDDDIRYMHYPAGYGCFCDNCIKIFNNLYGYGFDRETLKTALNSADEIEIRKKWLYFQGSKIENLLSFIGKTVREINPNIKIGLMSGERYFEGFDFKSWADALSEKGKYNIMWRPGGGAYNDSDFSEFITKSVEIGRQTALLPDYVDEVQSEIESFPYQILQKSPRSTATEGVLYLASGCNGTTWNILPNVKIGESINLIKNHFSEIRKVNSFMHLISDTADLGKSKGIFSGWHGNSLCCTDENFFTAYGGKFADGMKELSAIGLPEAFGFEDACCYMLKGRQPLCFAENEILKMLSVGVYLDAPAIKTLTDMGYGEYLGFSIGDKIAGDSEEVYANHPLNSGFISNRRCCYPVFTKGDAFSLIPIDNAEILCMLTDYKNEKIADCSVGLYKNKLGGTVIAASYYPWNDLMDSQKSLQMKRIFNALSQNKLPAFVSSYSRVRIFCRENNGNKSLVLFNGNLDRLENVTVDIKTDSHNIKAYNIDGNEIKIEISHGDCGYLRAALPELEPYSFYLIKLQERSEVIK